MGPLVRDYLGGLPLGLDSHPQCQAKGSLVRECLAVSKPADLSVLPSELQKLVREPPLPSSWIPEVHYLALSLAIVDTHRERYGSLYELWYDVMGTLLSSPLYRFSFSFISAERLVLGLLKRWGTFHQGITVTAHRDARLGFTLSYPLGLFSREVAEGFAGVFQRGAHATSQTGVSVVLADYQSAGARYALRDEDPAEPSPLAG